MAYLNKVDIMPGESLFSIAHRLARANHHGSFRWISADIGLLRGRTVFTVENIERLADLLAVAATCLDGRQATYLNGNENQVAILGDVFPVDLVEIKCSRLCVECFGNTGRHQLHWQLRSITHCHVHGRPLIHTCPTCKKKLNWTRRNLDRCSKGHPIYAQPNGDPPRLSSEALAGVRTVVANIPYLQDSSEVVAATSKIPGLGLCGTAMFLTLLGQIACHDPHSRPRPSRYEDVANDGIPQLSHGLRLAEDWPNVFQRYLVANRQQCALFGSQKRLWLARRLYQPRFPSDETIKGVIVETARTLGVYSFGMKRSEVVTLSSLSRETGHSRQFLAKSLGLAKLEHTVSYRAISVETGTSDKFEPSAREFRARMAALLRVNLKVVSELAADGVFGEAVKSRGRSKCFERAEIETFLDGIRSAVIPGASSDAVFWPEIAQSSEFRPNITLIIRAVLNKELRPISFDGDFRSLSFRSSDLDAYVAR